MYKNEGFSLIELAIVLVVVALLLGGLLVPLTMQIEQQKTKETQKILEDAKEAIIGFAIANGRLPCPASNSSNGQESFDTAAGGNAANGKCSNFYNGFLPAVTLGVNPVDANGYAVDAWALTQNRIRYAITTANSNAFTSTGGMAATTMSVLAPDLRVCATATGIIATNCGTAMSLSNNAVAVVYSLGKNAAMGGGGLDEAANLNSDAVFVSHIPSASTAANGDFDDLVTWLSPNILFNRMVAAGRLP
ncbi:hypothetical protein SKTS_04440 [Sulfurimicrobium lacus]|uniref:Prepilin-type N-terminal cleavage/methylation domain-containing protein n=1 Tax=Sulfurimicrobium lacus TaxID=2715678 RepID=A0A6F8V786_9PROT|nr:prepilin-type N-terminal cleavage/methylation domain-containing protein [Sulfurimicrobium lacus]BCB25558.1 hypothetical protein SKTS_04440 [Sulfurimicrobium lacus]